MCKVALHLLYTSFTLLLFRIILNISINLFFNKTFINLAGAD